MKKNKIKGYKDIFWDFDGVIKESFDIKTLAFIKLFPKSNEIIKKKIKNHHIKNSGISRFDKIPIYLNWAGITNTAQNKKRYLSKFSSLVQNEVIKAKWVKGVKEYLEANYKQQNFYVVSATPQKEMKDIVKRLDLEKYFKKICGSPKLKNEHIDTIIKEKKLRKKECILIGDSIADLKAAKKNKISFLLRIHNSNYNNFKSYKKDKIENFISLID